MYTVMQWSETRSTQVSKKWIKLTSCDTGKERHFPDVTKDIGKVEDLSHIYSWHVTGVDPPSDVEGHNLSSTVQIKRKTGKPGIAQLPKFSRWLIHWLPTGIVSNVLGMVLAVVTGCLQNYAASGLRSVLVGAWYGKCGAFHSNMEDERSRIKHKRA